jgi:hypothetical protein
VLVGWLIRKEHNKYVFIQAAALSSGIWEEGHFFRCWLLYIVSVHLLAWSR